MPKKEIVLAMDEMELGLLLELLFREGAAQSESEGVRRLACSELIARLLRGMVLANR